MLRESIQHWSVQAAASEKGRPIESLNSHELSQHPVKLAVFDIDGTLAHGTGSIDDSVVKEIGRIKAAGTKIALATGRAFFAAREVAELLGSDEPGMFFAGAYICRPLSGEVLLANYLHAPSVNFLVKEMRQEGMHVELYTADNFYIESENRFSEAHAAYIPKRPVLDSLDSVAQRSDLLKMVVVINERDRENLMRLVDGHPQFSVGVSTAHAHPGLLFFQLTDLAASREVAFNFLLNYHGVSSDNVAAFGDAESDVVFLSSARYGVAMSNASLEARRAASLVTKDVKESGVAWALTHLVPNQPSKVAVPLNGEV